MDFMELSNLCDQKDKIIQMQFSLIETALKPTMTITEKTLRDEFAIAALTGIMAKHDHLSPDRVAEVAFDYADAMLEARK